MKKSLPALWLACVLAAGLTISAQPAKRDLNKPVSPTARKMVADAPAGDSCRNFAGNKVKK